MVVATYCHGRLVRWGETSSQVSVRGLYLRWEMSSRILSGILISTLYEHSTEMDVSVHHLVRAKPRW